MPLYGDKELLVGVVDVSSNTKSLRRATVKQLHDVCIESQNYEWWVIIAKIVTSFESDDHDINDRELRARGNRLQYEWAKVSHVTTSTVKSAMKRITTDGGRRITVSVEHEKLLMGKADAMMNDRADDHKFGYTHLCISVAPGMARSWDPVDAVPWTFCGDTLKLVDNVVESELNDSWPAGYRAVPADDLKTIDDSSVARLAHKEVSLKVGHDAIFVAVCQMLWIAGMYKFERPPFLLSFQFRNLIPFILDLVDRSTEHGKQENEDNEDDNNLIEQKDERKKSFIGKASRIHPRMLSAPDDFLAAVIDFITLSYYRDPEVIEDDDPGPASPPPHYSNIFCAPDQVHLLRDLQHIAVQRLGRTQVSIVPVKVYDSDTDDEDEDENGKGSGHSSDDSDQNITSHNEENRRRGGKWFCLRRGDALFTSGTHASEATDRGYFMDKCSSVEKVSEEESAHTIYTIHIAPEKEINTSTTVFVTYDGFLVR